jgi:hypothetical protein
LIKIIPKKFKKFISKLISKFNAIVMKKNLMITSFLIFGFVTYGQVGIGTTAPNLSTQLEIVSSNKGVLIPQVPLTSASDVTTISNGNVESLLIYNTSTEVDLQPGYYYWNKDKWHRLGTDEKGNDKVKMIDNRDDTYTFTDGEGKVTVINKSAGGNLTRLVLNPDNKRLDYTDGKGVVTTIDLETVVNNLETKTTLAKNADGTFTYVNEAGTAVTLDGFIKQAGNGLSQNEQIIELGGTLTKPIQITTSSTNTMAIQGIQQGEVTDNLVVTDPTTGVLKSLPVSSLNNVRKIQIYTASDNQKTFMTPFPIADKDKLQVFRNGVEINFSPTLGTSTITLDFSKFTDDNITSCFAGDEIKIYQWK